MRFIDDLFPMLVVLHDSLFDDREMHDMVAGYERYFQRQERYAVLIASPGDSVQIDARGRKLIGDWVNEPRVRELSGRLCVGSAVVVPSAVSRGALTASLWFWTPPTPLRATATIETGIDYCLGRLALTNVPVPRSPKTIRDDLIGRLKDLGTFAPSLSHR